MRKMLLTPLIVCTVALLSTLSMPAVYATPWTTGGGTWDFSIPDTFTETCARERKSRVLSYELVVVVVEEED